LSLRVLISGAGAGIFRSHRRGLDAIGATVVGVHDPVHEKARRAGEQLGCPAFSELEQMLRATARSADLAVVLAPHPLHGPSSIECLRAGLHVLVEKPLAIHAAEGDAMIAEAERVGRILAVAFQRRSTPAVRAARRLIREGALGRLQRADVIAAWPRRTAYFSTAGWRGTWRGEGGGVLINQGQHDLDLLCDLVGRPSRVLAWTWNRFHGTETEDTALAMAEWPGGASGTIRLSTAEVDGPRRIELTGTAGRLQLEPRTLDLWRSDVDFDAHAVALGDPYAGPEFKPRPVELEAGGGDHTELYRNLAEALAGREPLLCSGEEALAALEVANAIILSAATRREVALPIDRGGYAAFLDQQMTLGLGSGR
jgi:predicted dehydrogenase